MKPEIKTKHRKSIKPKLKNQKGIAYVEMLFLLPLFVILYGLIFGLWTSIHSGTLRSIAARHYAFEALNNRTHYIYHRDTKPPESDGTTYYQTKAVRFFANVYYQENSEDLELIADERPINLFGGGVLKIKDENNNSNNKPKLIKIKTGYGICIDFGPCKDHLGR